MKHMKHLALILLLLATAGLADAPAAVAASRQSAEPELIRIPMLKRPIARDEIISADDIVWYETSARRMPGTAMTEAESLIGMAAQRYLPAGRVILARDIGAPLAVRKGDLVAIVYTTPYMTLTARGRVLEDAAAGASVRTLKSHSNRTVEATAIAPGIVATRPITHEQLAEAMR
jgi:flagellar basal body P-ring formation protein FlgA